MLTQKNIACVPVRIYIYMRIYFIFALPLLFLIFSPRPVNVLNVSLPKKFVSFVFFFIFHSNFFSVIHDGRMYANVIIKFSA